MEWCESISAWGSGGEAFLHREDGGGGDDDDDHNEFYHIWSYDHDDLINLIISYHKDYDDDHNILDTHGL